ncbi:hypothetical protein M407DRAFT_220810 [Tulasnella calospora MUT 4182]|uniref:FAD-binding PCMH-type domain-containing protein n=1 Tax=Tulasnella calospora MUT 4182 TaxID=1051891 RepID=A0A0C3LFS3_9AGAM|nr:hypothetical protein M407DRAFT_220810 [Tulasnella calospora MUT 4182]
MSPSVMFPSTFEDVAAAVRQAKSQGLDLAIRCGGHFTATGASGLVIDLSRSLSSVTIDAENQLAYVQGGCRFSQVEHEAIKFGGYGDIVEANATEHPDLFWGIRGGGSNFGIVVEFVFKLHTQRSDVYTTTLTYAPSLLPIVIQQINRWTRKQTPNEAGRLIFSADSQGKPAVVFIGFKNSDAKEGEAAFKGFVELGPLENGSGMVPYEKLNTMLDSYSVPGHRLHWGLHLERLDLKPFKKALEAFTNLLAEHPEAASSFVSFEFHHTDKIGSVPTEATAFAHRAPVYNALVTTQWEKAAFTAVAQAATRELADTIAKAASTDLATNIGYPNYADGVAGKNKTDTYSKLAFGANYERLQEVKKMYDPESVFSKWFPIQPAA